MSDTCSEGKDLEQMDQSGWESVRESLAELPALDTDLVDGDLYDKLHGGWLGKCIACAIAKVSNRDSISSDIDLPVGAIQDGLIDSSITRLQILEQHGFQFGPEHLSSPAVPDLWAFVFPGQPWQAVELAYRDASGLGDSNALFDALLATAMISAAFASDDVDEIVSLGRSAVPAGTHLAGAIENVRSWCSETDDWSAVRGKIGEAYDDLEEEGTISSVSSKLIGILCGKGNLEESVRITHCCDSSPGNAAAVGTVLGVMNETFGIPAHLKDAFSDRFESSVTGSESGRISDLARRTLDVVRRLDTNP